MRASQLTKIRNQDWNFLIVLDACRYDYFAKIYRKFGILKYGMLEAVISPATTTREWFETVFVNNKYPFNIIYISANPFINKRYQAKCPSLKIIDVWRIAWDNQLNTVHPKKVNSYALLFFKLYKNKNVRMVIHYMKPHFPYLSLGFLNKTLVRRLELEKQLRSKTSSAKIKGFIRWKLIKYLGVSGWALASKLVGQPLSIEFITARYIGKEALREAYENNLKIVFGIRMQVDP